MFCSTSITIHLLRGLAAAALLAAAAVSDGLPGPVRLAGVVGAFILMRGCPACWVIGLLESARRSGLAFARLGRRGDA